MQRSSRHHSLVSLAVTELGTRKVSFTGKDKNVSVQDEYMPAYGIHSNLTVRLLWLVFQHGISKKYFV